MQLMMLLMVMMASSSSSSSLKQLPVFGGSTGRPALLPDLVNGGGVCVVCAARSSRRCKLVGCARLRAARKLSTPVYTSRAPYLDAAKLIELRFLYTSHSTRNR